MNLKTIIFDDQFNQPIYSLSKLSKLENLTLGFNFNYPIYPLDGLVNLKNLNIKKSSQNDKYINYISIIKKKLPLLSINIIE